ncbi:MAG: hypothetical protein Q9209_007098 [Squamulea sp. 1 TL-2023]
MIRYFGFITRKLIQPPPLIDAEANASSNTDRLFALWQAIYPESNFSSSQVSAFGTLTNDPGSMEDVNTHGPSPFFVHLYLGAAPDNPGTWSFAPNLIGSHSVLDTSMLNTAANPDLPTTFYGQIPLNHALLAAGNSDLSPSKIVPLLRSQLTWELQNTEDVPLDISNVPSLKIHVVGQEVKPRVSDNEFPEYGHVQVYREVTEGKTGGLQEGEDVE